LVAGDVREHRLVARLDGVPIAAVHFRVVEAVLHDPPRLLEDLSPFGTRVDAYGERKVDAVLALVGQRETPDLVARVARGRSRGRLLVALGRAARLFVEDRA